MLRHFARTGPVRLLPMDAFARSKDCHTFYYIAHAFRLDSCTLRFNRLDSRKRTSSHDLRKCNSWELQTLLLLQTCPSGCGCSPSMLRSSRTCGSACPAAACMQSQFCRTSALGCARLSVTCTACMGAGTASWSSQTMQHWLMLHRTQGTTLMACR